MKGLPALLLVVALTACGTSDESPTGAEPTATPTPADAAPPFPDGTGRQTGDYGGRRYDLLLTDVRAASHDGYDRVVLELKGTGTPGWVANYVDEPVKDASGDRADIEADSYLDVYARGTTFDVEHPERPYPGPRLVRVDDGRVTGVYVVGWFEGDTQVLIGMDGEAVPFRVFTLRDPARLVIDVSVP